ncbi:MAG: cyclic nucleotide-binding domain-containing protein [Myxococcota bacterium]
MTAPLLKQLIQIPICRGLEEREAGEIFEIAEETSAKKGEVLFREGDTGNALFVVLEGSLDITKKDRAGKPQHLAKISDGSVLGEMSLVHGSSIRSATAQAASDVRLLRIPAERFSKLLEDERVSALKMVYNLAQVMSRRLLLMDEKLIELMERNKKKEELAEFHKLLADWSF